MLFGDTFLKRVISETKDEIDWNRHRDCFRRSEHQPRQHHPRSSSFRSGNPRQSNFPSQHQFNRGSFSSGSRSYRYFRLNYLQLEENTPIGARLQQFSASWYNFTDDLWVLDTVKFGLRLDFSSPLHQHCLSKPPSLSSKLEKLCEVQVNELLTKKAVSEISRNAAGFISIRQKKPRRPNFIWWLAR